MIKKILPQNLQLKFYFKKLQEKGSDIQSKLKTNQLIKAASQRMPNFRVGGIKSNEELLEFIPENSIAMLGLSLEKISETINRSPKNFSEDIFNQNLNFMNYLNSEEGEIILRHKIEKAIKNDLGKLEKLFSRVDFSLGKENIATKNHNNNSHGEIIEQQIRSILESFNNFIETLYINQLEKQYFPYLKEFSSGIQNIAKKFHTEMPVPPLVLANKFLAAKSLIKQKPPGMENTDKPEIGTFEDIDLVQYALKNKELDGAYNFISTALSQNYPRIAVKVLKASLIKEKDPLEFFGLINLLNQITRSQSPKEIFSREELSKLRTLTLKNLDEVHREIILGEENYQRIIPVLENSILNQMLRENIRILKNRSQVFKNNQTKEPEKKYSEEEILNSSKDKFEFYYSDLLRNKNFDLADKLFRKTFTEVLKIKDVDQLDDELINLLDIFRTASNQNPELILLIGEADSSNLFKTLQSLALISNKEKVDIDFKSLENILEKNLSSLIENPNEKFISIQNLLKTYEQNKDISSVLENSQVIEDSVKGRLSLKTKSPKNPLGDVNSLEEKLEFLSFALDQKIISNEFIDTFKELYTPRDIADRANIDNYLRVIDKNNFNELLKLILEEYPEKTLLAQFQLKKAISASEEKPELQKQLTETFHTILEMPLHSQRFFDKYFTDLKAKDIKEESERRLADLKSVLDINEFLDKTYNFSTSINFKSFISEILKRHIIQDQKNNLTENQHLLNFMHTNSITPEINLKKLNIDFPKINLIDSEANIPKQVFVKSIIRLYELNKRLKQLIPNQSKIDREDIINLNKLKTLLEEYTDKFQPLKPIERLALNYTLTN